MQCLVIYNCATRALVANTQALFPDWDVRGVSVDLANKWLETQENEAFSGFCQSCDFYIGFEQQKTPALALKPDAIVATLPTFLFRGFHPDVVQLFGGPPSPIAKEGSIYSRLLTVAFLLGMDQSEAASLFTPDIFERVGYLEAFHEEKTRLIEKFKSHGLDIRDAFARWLTPQDGAFVYVPNHGRQDVYADLVWLVTHGDKADAFPIPALTHQELLNQATCIFDKPVTWPVYPAIADALQMTGSLTWKSSITDGHQSLSLEQFIQRSYDHMARFEALTPEQVPGFEIVAAALDAR